MIKVLISAMVLSLMAACSAKAPSEEEKIQPYTEDDVQRVNAPYAIGYTQIIRPAAGNTEYPDAAMDMFQQGRIEPGEEVYANYWGLYQFFLGGDVQKPESTVCLHHNVHFYLTVDQNEKQDARRVRPRPELIDVDALGDDEFLTAQSKSCGDPKSAQHILSFRMFNYHQPTLTRNLLVLTKAGFFDDRRFFFWQKESSLPTIGMTSVDWEPIVYPPEPRFGDGRAPKFPGDYLGAVVDNPMGVALTRQVVPFRTAFVDQEGMNRKDHPLRRQHRQPVAIGQLYAPYPNSIKDVADLSKLAGKLKVACAAIDVPVVSSFLVKEKACALTGK